MVSCDDQTDAHLSRELLLSLGDDPLAVTSRSEGLKHLLEYTW